MKHGTHRVRKPAVRRKVAPPRSRIRKWRCEYDGAEVVNGYCPSCELYNAGVHAQQAGASYLAKQKHPRAVHAWLNEYGVFAWVNGVSLQVGTPEEAAPFVELTAAARRVKTFAAPLDRSKTSATRPRST